MSTCIIAQNEGRGRRGWQRWSPVYWLEALAIIAFGLSWIVKGQWILKDG